MDKIICSGCGRKIKDGEEFYLYEASIYCDHCTETDTITTYSFAQGDWISENEAWISKFDNLKNFKDHVRFLKGVDGEEINVKKLEKMLNGDEE